MQLAQRQDVITSLHFIGSGHSGLQLWDQLSACQTGVELIANYVEAEFNFRQSARPDQPNCRCPQWTNGLPFALPLHPHPSIFSSHSLDYWANSLLLPSIHSPSIPIFFSHPLVTGLSLLFLLLLHFFSYPFLPSSYFLDHRFPDLLSYRPSFTSFFSFLPLRLVAFLLFLIILPPLSSLNSSLFSFPSFFLLVLSSADQRGSLGDHRLPPK